MIGCHRKCRGFTLIELLVSLALAGLLLVATSGLLNNTMGTEEFVAEQNRLQRDARFAMQRMVTAVGATPRLVLPTRDKPDTNWRENVREETVPASSPEGSSTKATAVLAVCPSPTIDLDGDGFSDADNDRDGRIDEDYPADISNDGEPGLQLIDDGGDGSVDEGFFFADRDDDERFGFGDEDAINGIDDDGDGVVDEDPGADMNDDGAPGIANVDDDGDGVIDEGSASDDDEDGLVDEDWLDTVVFYLQGDRLIERRAVPWDESADGSITGSDYIESVIAENVTKFRVERLSATSSDLQLVELTLEITGPTGQVASLSSRTRVGGAL